METKDKKGPHTCSLAWLKADHVTGNQIANVDINVIHISLTCLTLELTRLCLSDTDILSCFDVFQLWFFIFSCFNFISVASIYLSIYVTKYH